MGRKLRVECLTEWDVGQKGTQGVLLALPDSMGERCNGQQVGSGMPDGMGCWSKGHARCAWLCLTQWENGALGSRLGEGAPDGMGYWPEGLATGRIRIMYRKRLRCDGEVGRSDVPSEVRLVPKL